MKHTVVWQPAAERHLADLWTNAPDRNAVATAADTIDRQLSRDPLTWGEARSGPTRIMFVPPLAVLFDLSEPDRMVSVWAVWRTD
jgi:hypothetical protein